MSEVLPIIGKAMASSSHLKRSLMKTKRTGSDPTLENARWIWIFFCTRHMVPSRVLGKRSDPRTMVKRFNNVKIDPKEGKGRCLARLS